ncbi:MAG TPA: PP2C family protein-serine/threonine phosphatase [Sporichthya sp.]|nr:PP2C family protein-serine/threonine phosphatase [Sporichthya sp.]
MPAPSPPAEDAQRRSINVLLQQSGLTHDELWIRYFAMGGIAGPLEVEAYLQGMLPLPPIDRDVLAQSLNEHLDDIDWPGRVPYLRLAREYEPLSGPLAALVELLDGAYLAAPEHLGTLVHRAAAMLDIEIVTYLSDHTQELLVPLPSPGADGRSALRIEGTLAGRAYQLVRTLPSTGGGSPHLWVPVLDGLDRLGVLDVAVKSEADLEDPGLRTQCRWLSATLGHLISAMGGHGDVLEATRHRRPRSVGGELVSSLLPPLTSGVDGFLLAGSVEPATQGRGDAFDYGLSATHARLAIFDAMGHDLRASLIAAAALAAYRTARREGAGVYEQARVIDKTIADQFPDAFCTGVVCELDLRTGRLRYLSAGHPAPLVYRAGKVVRRLEGGRRLPFGFDDSTAVTAEETLQPGDWLALFTDGITEARRPDKSEFGEDRLADFLIRAAAAGQPPPETVRRLAKAVLAHQGGALEDDATVVLASWNHYDFADYDLAHVNDSTLPHDPASRRWR